ncbi:MAG: M1 family peptidase, partial [Bacteroidota bacterium]
MLASLTSFAQDYFQQQANFTITATLDDEKHQLHGHWSMDYHNNSPDTLTYIYLHLWPNAYATKTTAFAQQKLRNDDTEFYFADESELGFIDSLNFTTGAETLAVEATDLGPDVIILRLNEPLLPGHKTNIQSPFRLQFPASFS